MLSRASTRPPQAKQCDGGVTTEMPRGMRAMQTLRKLPQMAPKAAATKSAGIRQAARYSARGGNTSRRYHWVIDFAASRCASACEIAEGGAGMDAQQAPRHGNRDWAIW